MDYFIRACTVLLLLGTCLGFSARARPVSFSEEFEVTSTKDHVIRMADNNSVQVILDRNGGAAFVSKHQYMYGLVSVKIKLVAGDSAGTVTTFYVRRSKLKSKCWLSFSKFWAMAVTASYFMTKECISIYQQLFM